MNNKIVVVIPTYTNNEKLETLAINACRSYRSDRVSVLVCEDGQMYSDGLRNESDYYIYNKRNVGFTKNVNRGWKYAIANGADYVAIVNSDTLLKSGRVEDLCVPDTVTSPLVGGNGQFWGCFWVCPTLIANKRGLLNESLKTYYSDDEYYQRIKDIFKVVETVDIFHHGAESVSTAGLKGKMDEDKQIYENILKR